MKDTTTPTPLETARKASAELANLKQRIATLRSDKSALQADPALSIEAEVSRMTDEGQRIDAELVKLNASVAIYNERLLGLWQAADSDQRPKLIAALDEAIALKDEGVTIADQLYSAIAPEGQAIISQDTRGVLEARALHDEIYSHVHPWRDSGINSLIGIVNRAAEFLPSIPDRITAIRETFTKLSAVTGHIEAVFAPPVETTATKPSGRAAKRAEDEPS